MTADALAFAAIDGLAAAAELFLVAAGLSLIFGVTRIVNLAHGSLAMLGLYVAYSLQSRIGYWPGMLGAALVTAGVGAAIELIVLRRLADAPELLQLLATFALVLVISDAALVIWGPEDLLGPRAPGFTGSVALLGRRLPTYDLALIAIAPLVLIALRLIISATRFGRLVRAASQDRAMLGVLGVDQAWLFTATFALGAGLAGLGGALQLAREPASLGLDLTILSDAFVVVVVGGLGSIEGAFLASILIAQVKALCIGIGVAHIAGVAVNVAQFTLVAEFAVMAVVLATRPHGLLGRAQSLVRGEAARGPSFAPLSPRGRRVAMALIASAALLPLVASGAPYAIVIAQDCLIAALFAASLHLLVGPGGLQSFGHAAFFGLGAYAAALAASKLGAPLPVALLAAASVALGGGIVFGWFAVRLTGVYFAMLTLALAQITWSLAFSWDALTGGSNGLIGLWPGVSPTSYYELTLALVALTVFALRRAVFSRFGLRLRAARDDRERAQASGIDVTRTQGAAFAIAAAAAGVAGGLSVFAKGALSPEALGLPRSIDGLVMVVLGGVGSLTGPLIGAGAVTLLQDGIARATDYSRAALGLVILGLVFLFPAGLARR